MMDKNKGKKRELLKEKEINSEICRVFRGTACRNSRLVAPAIAVVLAPDWG